MAAMTSRENQEFSAIDIFLCRFLMKCFSLSGVVTVTMGLWIPVLGAMKQRKII
jgi:hypothetical protein